MKRIDVAYFNVFPLEISDGDFERAMNIPETERGRFFSEFLPERPHLNTRTAITNKIVAVYNPKFEKDDGTFIRLYDEQPIYWEDN